MRDGKTKQLHRPAFNSADPNQFFESHEVKVVVIAGDNVGVEFPLEAGRVTLGRGPGVDFIVNDETMSRQHAAIDYSEDGFRIQDLGSTNGLTIDEQSVKVGPLDNGSRFEIGDHVFQLVIQDRESTPEVYELPSGS